MNLLRNPTWNGEVYTPAGEVSLVIPQDWGAGWLDKGTLYQATASGKVVIGVYNKYGPRARPGMAQCLKPEILQILAVPPYLAPPRTEPPQGAVTGFKSWGTCCWWVTQKVSVTPGKKYLLSARGHAWAARDEDGGNPFYSYPVGVGLYAMLDGSGVTPEQANFRFRVGVDLNASANPLSPTVRWGYGIHIYNEFYTIPPCAFTASGSSVTVFLMVDNLWGYLNSNAYLSSPILEEVTEDLTEVWDSIHALEAVTADHEARLLALEGETPTPIPPPVVVYPRPTSRAGVHITSGNKDGYGAFLANCGRSICVQSVEDFGVLMQAHEVNPATVTIARIYPDGYEGDDTPPGNWQWEASQSKAIAVDWMSRCYRKLDLNTFKPDYVGVINEPDPSDESSMCKANDFMLYCMEDADKHGVKLAIWAWTAGLPRTPRISATDMPQAELSLTSLRYAADNGHCLSMHDGSVNGSRRLLYQAYEDQTALRYRVYKTLMDEQGWVMPPIVITEAYQVGGYKNPDWNDWAWYFGELQNDPYVLGSCWFTLGQYGEENIAGKTLAKYADIIASIPEAV